MASMAAARLRPKVASVSPSVGTSRSVPLSRLAAFGLLSPVGPWKRSCNRSTRLNQRLALECGPCASPGSLRSCCSSHVRRSLLEGAWSTSMTSSTEVSNRRDLSGQCTSPNLRNRRSKLPELVFQMRKSSTRRRPMPQRGPKPAAWCIRLAFAPRPASKFAAAPRWLSPREGLPLSRCAANKSRLLSQPPRRPRLLQSRAKEDEMQRRNATKNTAPDTASCFPSHWPQLFAHVEELP